MIKRLLPVFAALILVLQAIGPAHAAVAVARARPAIVHAGATAEALSPHRPRVVLARPAIVHAGDPVWLSGRGFPHHQRLQLVMTCYRPTPTGSMAHPRLIRRLAWVTTGAHGGFQRVRVRAPNLHNRKRILCRIAARTATNRGASDIDALYAILPRAKQA